MANQIQSTGPKEGGASLGGITRANPIMLDLVELKRKTDGVSQHIISRQAPWLPIFGAESLQGVVQEALKNDEPLFFCGLVCPNWVVTGEDRSVEPIDEANINGRTFFGEELPELLRPLSEAGVRTKTLIVVSDIFHPSWVVNVKKCVLNTAQNAKQMRRWFSQIGGPALQNTHVQSKDALPEVRIILQSELFNRIGPTTSLINGQMTKEVQTPATVPWTTFIKNWQIAEENQIYPNRRENGTGLKKIAERISFLTALTLSDGILMPLFLQSAFGVEHVVKPAKPHIIGVDLEMDTPFAEITFNGWRAGREIFKKFMGDDLIDIEPTFPVIAPTTHGTDWGEDHTQKVI